MIALAKGHVDGAVGRVDPPLRDEPERSGARRLFGQLELDEVLARHPLIPAAAGEVEMAVVAGTDDVEDVAALIVAHAEEVLHRRGGDRVEPRRRHREALVHEHFGAFGMIDDEQRDEIEEVRLPQLRGDREIGTGRCAARAGRLGS